MADVAALTGLSRQTVTRLFEHEPGVIILERPRRCTSSGIAVSGFRALFFDRDAEELEQLFALPDTQNT